MSLSFDPPTRSPQSGSPPMGQRDRSRTQHAPITESLRPAERDAGRVGDDHAGEETERPQAQRVADANEEARTSGNVNIQQAIPPREERTTYFSSTTRSGLGRVRSRRRRCERPRPAQSGA